MTTTTSDNQTRLKWLKERETFHRERLTHLEGFERLTDQKRRDMATSKKWLQHHKEEIALVSAINGGESMELVRAKIYRIPVNRRLRLVLVEDNKGNFEESGRMWCKDHPRLKPGRMVLAEKHPEMEGDYLYVREYRGEDRVE